MISLFSRAMDYQIQGQFRKDPSGRLVFFPFTSKGKAYFIESKSDEEKIRSFVKLFRSAIALISFLIYPSLFVPAFILEDYAGLSPKQHRLAIALGIPLFFWLILGALAWMLWGVYKGAIPVLTASLSEVGPDLKRQLSEASPSRLLALLCLFAGIILLGVGILVAWHYSYR
jgi:hypothetical protein